MRGLACRLALAISGAGRVGRTTMAGNPTTGSSLKPPPVSRVIEIMRAPPELPRPPATGKSERRRIRHGVERPGAWQSVRQVRSWLLLRGPFRAGAGPHRPRLPVFRFASEFCIGIRMENQSRSYDAKVLQTVRKLARPIKHSSFVIYIEAFQRPEHRKSSRAALLGNYFKPNLKSVRSFRTVCLIFATNGLVPRPLVGRERDAHMKGLG